MAPSSKIGLGHLALTACVCLLGQQAPAQEPCGAQIAPADIPLILNRQQSGIYTFSAPPTTPVSVSIAFHVVRWSDGSGGLPASRVTEALGDANLHFSNSGIQFCWAGSIDYIDSDDFYANIHTQAQIDALRQIHGVPNAVNVFFTANLCDEVNGCFNGIGSPTWEPVQGVVVANNYVASASSHTTLSHELGHYFDLLHTHETAFGMECVGICTCDGVCSRAGDLLCDTPADPRLGPLNVDSSCRYIGTATDCSGLLYTPLVTNLMSYAGNCRTVFTTEQNTRMRATLEHLRSNIIVTCPNRVRLIDLGTLPGGDASYANGVSRDGSVVVGTSTFPPGSSRAFRWTSAGGMVNIGAPLGGSPSFGNAISSDGSVIVGIKSPSVGNRAFRWTSAERMTELADTNAIAYGVSNDGSIIVGTIDNRRAFRWTNSTGLVDIGSQAGTDASFANSVSGDGSVIVGASYISNSNYIGDHAFRWTNARGFQEIPATYYTWRASATNGNGSIVVGSGLIYQCCTRAILWTGDVARNLGTLSGNNADAFGVNADGTVVVGSGLVGSESHAFLWTPDLDMVDLNTYLPLLGVSVVGWTLNSANGVSADGSAIVGNGIFNGAPRGWIVTGLPSHGCRADFNTDMVVDFFDYLDFLSAFASSAVSADFNRDQIVDFFDYLDFVQAFSEGC